MTDTFPAATQPSTDAAQLRLVDTRRFAWFDLCCALIAGAMWYLTDGRLGPWPLLIAGIPWGVRIAAGRFPVQRTRFDPLVWAFVASALIGALLAYDPALAWGKFWLIVGATVLFHSLAAQHARDMWPIVSAIGFSAVGLSVYFLLTNDWLATPVKVQAINDIALNWMQIRPAQLSGLHQLHPNVAGGLIAMLFPLTLAAGIRAGYDWHRLAIIPTIAGCLLLAAALIMTSSRGAWVALLGGFTGWCVWLLAGYLHERLFLTRRLTLALIFIAIGLIGLTVVLLSPCGVLGLLDRLPGPANAGSRLSISQDALNLMGDFPVVGAGLGAFDGLYSQYIRVIPSHYLIHSHNLFLNVGVEQGLVGLLLLLGLIGAGFWWLSDPEQSQPCRTIRRRALLAGALFATLVVMCVHGLVDDPLYGSRAVLLLWLPLGLTAGLFPIPPRNPQSPGFGRPERTTLIGLGLLLLMLTIFGVMSRDNLLAIIESSRGALEMARVELADYPTNQWSDGREAPYLQPAQRRFEKALALDPDNRTAWHRLGLIAMIERDYDQAGAYLREANRLDPDHPGIRKNLAYSEIWSGRVDEGATILRAFPEAQAELGSYAWWWDQQGRNDLSQLAQAALRAISEGQSVP